MMITELSKVKELIRWMKDNSTSDYTLDSLEVDITNERYLQLEQELIKDSSMKIDIISITSPTNYIGFQLEGIRFIATRKERPVRNKK